MEGFFPLLFPAGGIKLSTPGGKLQGESLPKNLFLEVLAPLLHEVSDTEGGKTTPECLSSLIDRAVEGEIEDESEASLFDEIGFPAVAAVPWQGVFSLLLVPSGRMVEGETECQSGSVLDLPVSNGEGTLEGEPSKAVTITTEVTELLSGNDTSGSFGKTTESVVAQGTGQGGNGSVFYPDSMLGGKAPHQSELVLEMPVLDREGALRSITQQAESRTSNSAQLPADTSQEELLADVRTALAQDTAVGENRAGRVQEHPDNAQVLLRGTADFQQAGDKNSIMTQGIEQVQGTEAELPAQKVIDQIVEKAHLFLGKDESALRLQLKPELLGHLDLVVKVEKGLVHAHFIAENAAVAKMIQGHLPELRQSLEQQGISWQQLSVSVESQSGSTGFSSSGSGAESSSEDGSPGYQGSFEGRSGEQQERGERPQLTGLVDYLI